MSFSSFGWGATSSQKSWFDYSLRHQNSLTNFLLKEEEKGLGQLLYKKDCSFYCFHLLPILTLAKKPSIIKGVSKNSKLVGIPWMWRKSYKSKGKALNDLITEMDCFLVFLHYFSSPSLYLFFRPFWEILSRKLDDDDVMLSWKLVRKSEIRFPMPFLRWYIDQIFSACLIPLFGLQDDATFLLHTFSDLFDQERKMKRNWAYNLTHLTISFWIVHRIVTNSKMKKIRLKTSV